MGYFNNGLYESLSALYEAKPPVKIEKAHPIDLSSCRMITSDVIDIRNELERSACIDYVPASGKQPVLSRVAVRTLVFRRTDKGLEFLGRNKGYMGISIPGGGYDIDKDGKNLANTARREIYEELNIDIKNIRISEVAYWKQYEDHWVDIHVANEEDRWHGYYQFIATAEYESRSDNNNPEELNRYKWLPITVLESARVKETKFYAEAAKAAGYTSESLSEDWGNGQHGEMDYEEDGKISYCVSNPTSLSEILKDGYITGSKNKEAHETDTEIAKGGRKVGQIVPKKYSYVAFSKHIFSHAWRRTNKWGFGLVIDKNKLLTSYELSPRSHEYYTANIKAITKTTDGKYYLRTTTMGTTEISQELFDMLADDLLEYGKFKQLVYDNVPIKSGEYEGTLKSDMWRTIATKKKFDSVLNSDIVSHQVERTITYAGYNASYSLPIKDLPAEHRQKLMDWWMSETYFNEGEERVWLKSDTENKVILPEGSIVGVILPALIEDNYNTGSNDGAELQMPNGQLAALHDIRDYVEMNHLKVYWHHAGTVGNLGKLDAGHEIKSKNNTINNKSFYKF